MGECRYDKGSLIEEVEKRTGEHITRNVVYCKDCIFHKDKTTCKFFEHIIKDDVVLCLNEDSYCCFGFTERDVDEFMKI